MESSTTQPTPTVTEKIVKVPAEIGAEIVQGTETIARDSAQALVAAATVLVEAGKTAVRDIAKASEELAHDLHRSATPEPATPEVATTIPAAPLIPAVALAAAVTVPV